MDNRTGHSSDRNCKTGLLLQYLHHHQKISRRSQAQVTNNLGSQHKNATSAINSVCPAHLPKTLPPPARGGPRTVMNPSGVGPRRLKIRRLPVSQSLSLVSNNTAVTSYEVVASMSVAYGEKRSLRTAYRCSRLTDTGRLVINPGLGAVGRETGGAGGG